MATEIIEVFATPTEVVEVLTTGPVGPQANINYTVVSSSQAVSNRQLIAANTLAGSFTLTLPSNPAAGDAIDIFDYSDTFDTNALTIGHNGKNIEGEAEDLVANVEGAYFTLIFTGDSRGWQVVPRYGVAGVSTVSGTAPIVSSGGATPTLSITAATTSAAGSISSEDKTKLDGIATGAEVNVQSNWTESNSALDSFILNKPATFPPSAHEHQPDEVYADAAFVSQSGDSSLQIGIYLHNGTDNGRPVYESPTTGDYIWWDSNLDQWYLTSNTDVNLYYLDENADEFPWETDVVWNAIPPQTGNIEVDQAFLSDISDYGVASVIGLKTSKSGNASSTELVLGSDTRLTNSRTPSSTLAHASTHHLGGSDALTAANIGAAAAAHTHGNLTNDGKVGSTSGLPLVTTTAGAVTTLALGTANQVLRVNSGATGVEFGAGFDAASPPAIGSTTPNTGAFTSLSANNGTLTASAPVLDLAQTWNNAAVAFTAINLDITNTASAFGSQFLQFSIAGVPQVRFQRNFSTPVLYFGNSDTGIGSSSTTLSVYANGGATASFGAGGGGMNLRSDSPYSWASSTNLTSANDLSLFRDAADTLAQRRTTNPQVFRIYNTYTDASNHERGFMRWSSNVLQIGTEKGGTGSARALEFQTDGVTRMTIAGSGGTINVGSGAQFGSNGIQVASTASLRFSGGAIGSSSDLWMLRSGSGIIRFATGSSTSTADFNRLQFGGTTSSFPALKRDTTTLQVKLADNSAFTAIAASNLVLTDNTGAETATFDAQSKLTDNRTYDLPDRSGTMVVSDTSAGSGSDVVNNIVSLTQAEYDAIVTPDAATLFIIV
jgi:hypothetical protein